MSQKRESTHWESILVLLPLKIALLDSANEVVFSEL